MIRRHSIEIIILTFLLVTLNADAIRSKQEEKSKEKSFIEKITFKNVALCTTGISLGILSLFLVKKNIEMNSHIATLTNKVSENEKLFKQLTEESKCYANQIGLKIIKKVDEALDTIRQRLGNHAKMIENHSQTISKLNTCVEYLKSLHAQEVK